MTTVLVNSERREFSRIVLKPRAVLQVGAVRLACRLSDISLQGALVCTDTTTLPVREGQPCTLTVQLDLGAAIIEMKGAIAHVGDDRVGIVCRDMDLDSFRHLRRLLELNLAEDKLVRSELVALARHRRR